MILIFIVGALIVAALFGISLLFMYLEHELFA